MSYAFKTTPPLKNSPADLARQAGILTGKHVSVPGTEPNSLPPLFSDVQDWRDTYATYVGEFNASAKTYSDEVLLKIHLRRLGFVGVNLANEFRHVVENA
jgi:hypothetical protein